MVVQFSILVGNVADLIGLGYSRIEIYQSIDQGNSYQEITSSTTQAAILESSEANTTFRMGGKLLKIKVDGEQEQSISFSSLIEYWTPTQVANRINEVIASLASVDGLKVILTSPTTGRSSSIEITYNDALDLGWLSGRQVFGKAARIALASDTLVYSFTDQAGEIEDRYKWRFSDDGSNPISDFSSVISGHTSPLIDASDLSIGTARFLNTDGHPRKTRILIATDSSPQSLVGMFVSQIQPLVIDSDDNGYLQFTLIRGSKVKVAIEGTAYVREFIVPDATSFDLLTVMSTATDPFTIQSVPPLLTRRTL